MTEGSLPAVPPAIRKFNPGTMQSDEAIVGQFVVRHRELGIVLDIVRANIDANSAQHVLLVAPRGRGKTMLLARVAAEIRRDDALRSHFLPVRFMEESQEIFGLADFWLETLFHLARETATDHPILAAELRTTHAALAGRWQDQALPDLARAAVMDAADRLDRRLVLMIENLQSLCRTVEPDFGWQLRSVLQNVPEIVLLASATTRFQALDDAREPFFELFRLVDLKPLGTEDCARLWQLARGEPIHASSVRPLEILTGGSPRLLVILAGFAGHLSLRQLMEELVALIDQHTEYFRGHLEVLPKGERRVYVALIDLWTPSTANEVAARARMDIRAVSTMLGRLIDRGIVVTDPRGPNAPRKGRVYAAAEPLYSIYYKLRRERDEAAVVESLVHFMVALYDTWVFHRWERHLTSELIDSPALHAGVERALARLPESGLDVTAYIKRRTLQQASENAAARRRLNAVIQLDREVEAGTKAHEWRSILDAAAGFVAACGPGDYPSREADEVHVARIRTDAYQHLGDYRKVLEIGNDIVERYRHTREVFIEFQTAQVLLNIAFAHNNLREYSSSIATAVEFLTRFEQYADNAKPALLFAQAMHIKASSHAALGETGVALGILDEIFERFGGKSEPVMSTVLARVLADKAELQRPSDERAAAATYDAAAARLESADAPGRSNLLENVYLNRAFTKAGLGDFTGEIESYRAFLSLIDADPAEPPYPCTFALVLLGLRLAELGQVEQAAVVADRLSGQTQVVSGHLRTFLGWSIDCIALITLAVSGKMDDVPAGLQDVCARYRPGDDVTTRLMIRLVLNLLALGVPGRDLIRALAIEPEASNALAPLTTALRLHLGESVRAPAEVMQVAADVRARIDTHAAKGSLTPF